MTRVLHLQSRAYPLQYAVSGHGWDAITVPRRGSFLPVPGSLGSMAYNMDDTVEGDLTAIISGVVELPGTTIVACRFRALAAGGMILTYALRHDADLRRLDAQALAAFDADINRRLREMDAAVIREVFVAAVGSDLLEAAESTTPDGEPVRLDARCVRYNCHFVTEDPSWRPDPRVPELVVRPGCRVLLPFTYAWAGDPTAPIDEIMMMLEPADLAVVQFSLLTGAIMAGRSILFELGRGESGRLEGDDFRRFLDLVWANYYFLDAYRVESAQDHRATYLAARQTMGLDGSRERAERLLRHVSASLLAESSSRSEQLDRRLNRVAAALTVVAGGGFLVDVASFILPDAPGPVRVGLTAAIVAAAVGTLLLVIRRRADAAAATTTMASTGRIPHPRRPDSTSMGQLRSTDQDR